MKQPTLLRWFRWLTQWVRQIFNRRGTRKKPLIILERIYSADELIVLLSIERDAPGAVGTWYLLHRRYPRYNLLITLDNLAAIRLALRQQRVRGSAMSPLELSLIQDDEVIRTHRFSILWITKLKSSRKVISFIGTWDADLQGDRFDPNSSAITILRLVVREALNLQPLPGVSWRLRMTDYPWAESVQSYANSVLGEKHNCYIKEQNLQPLYRQEG
ncbi:MAG TPA: hypothetical protein DDZ80_04000 [Cyanobacteria bacterium UBA8803]|nr:hypothetical protein [Cyanobacteria bacterium UBA9273]HBL57725.1 hypothetical protein [Cyanobacteria bacterium UBA8803]